MRAGMPVIHQGVVRDAATQTYGSPDLLIRSDVLDQLFPRTLQPGEATEGAPDLGSGSWHYRVVDVKYATLGLSAGGELDNSGSAPAYKLQVFSYNRAQGRLQGYLPPAAYLLGRGWEQTRRGETTRVFNCVDRLAPVPNDYASRAKGPLFAQADAAEKWLRRMRREGADWSPLPIPSVPELHPNAKGDPGPWRSVVKQIVSETEDLTQLWFVGPQKRWEANAKGLERWTDPSLTPADVGVAGPTTGPRLQALLDVNRDPDGSAARPQHIGAARDQWHTPAPVEFYVDFETVSDLDDDFSRIPERGGQNLIFMIGCGHLEDGEWRYECFTTESLHRASRGRDHRSLDRAHGVSARSARSGCRPEGDPLVAPRGLLDGGGVLRRGQTPPGEELAPSKLVRLPHEGGAPGARRGARTNSGD